MDRNERARRDIRVAIAGNPNAGKTSLWNVLTGSRAHVGNYPGVTVEKREAALHYPRPAAANAKTAPKHSLRLVDLPGTYSLSATSPEEVVAREFIVDSAPDVVVQVLDATNLERNLYLSTQLRELGCRVVYALNMYDVAVARGIVFDLPTLSQRFGGAVIPTVGTRGVGLDALLDAVVDAASRPPPDPGSFAPAWGDAISASIGEIAALLPAEAPELAGEYPQRWLAARLIEGEQDLLDRVGSPKLRQALDDAATRITHAEGRVAMIAMAEARYGWIAGACAGAVFSAEEQRDRSGLIDKVLCNRVLGLPIFAALMYLMFQLVFTLGEPPMEWIENGFSWLGERISLLFPKGEDNILRDLLVDGVIGGVGGVVVFLPNIVLLFLAISFLEDTGYMARAAFLMDRLMRHVGLQGKSFIPMLLGFGCTVPGIMATRTLENRRDRLTTILVLPFMSCGARLPIYMLLVPAFFGQDDSAWVVWTLYIIGIVVALICAKALRGTVFKGESVPFVMELPPYRVPTLRNVLYHMWDRAWSYLRKAGTVILAVSIVLWAMSNYPEKPEGEFERNYQALNDANVEKFLAAAAEPAHDAPAFGGAASLRELARLDLDAGAVADGYWEWEAGFAERNKEVEERLAALFAAPDTGPMLKALHDEIILRRDENVGFAGDSEKLDKDSAEYKELAAALEGARRKRAERNPALAALAAAYLDEVRPAFDETRRKYADERAGEELAYSITGRVGGAMEPFIRPLGFDWRIGTALVGAFAAKEVFVSQLGIVFKVGEADESSDGLRQTLRKHYTPLQAFAMMVFCLLSAPCVATIAVTRRETGGWGWALGMLVGLTVIAYIVTLAVYQGGMALGWGQALPKI